jgi:hypothetical protein
VISRRVRCQPGALIIKPFRLQRTLPNRRLVSQLVRNTKEAPASGGLFFAMVSASVPQDVAPPAKRSRCLTIKH